MRLRPIALAVSLASLSLAACGSDETEDDPIVENPTTIKAEELGGTYVLGTEPKEYITLWYRGSPNGGEMGDYVGSLDRNDCLDWKLEGSKLTLTYLSSASTFAAREETTDEYTVSKSGSALVLTDAADSSRVFTLDPSIENYKESIFDSDLQGKKWIGSNGEVLTLAASGNSGTRAVGGDVEDITWKRSSTSRVVYLIGADGMWNELEVETDGLGRVTLKDLDNKITYIKENDQGAVGSGVLDQLIAAAKGTGRWTLGGTNTLNGLWIFRKNVLGIYTWYYQANNEGSMQGTGPKVVGDKVVCTDGGTDHELTLVVDADGKVTGFEYAGKQFLPDTNI